MFRMNMINERRYIDKLNKLTKKLQPSRETGKDYCVRCSHCCWQRPGGLNQKDVPIIAKKLKITPEKLFEKYLVVDRLGFTSEYILLPRRREQDDIAGSFVPSDRTFDINTPCIFLKNKSCTINDVKPYMCRVCECWNSDKHTAYWEAAELKKLGWSGSESEYD